MTPVRLITAMLLALSTSASGLFAQERTRTPAELGTIAAERESLVPIFFLGMLGGTGIGLTGAHYVGSDSDRFERPYAYGAGGVAIIIGTGIAIEVIGNSPPDPQLEPGATTAYRQAYRDRLASRRRNALALGGLAGIGTGILLYRLLPRLQQ